MNNPKDENMTMDHFEHLDPKIVDDFDETVECFKEFKPAIAIVEVGKSSQGTLKTGVG
jgi:hypothetical protein